MRKQRKRNSSVGQMETLADRQVVVEKQRSKMK